MALAERIAAIQEQIAQACLAAGRTTDSVRLLPMSKTQPIETILAARRSGLQTFGENRPQELAAKAIELADTDIKLCFVGHLQTNKARLVAQYATEFQALDSQRLAIELDRRCHAIGRQLDVLVQVNTSDESQKYGIQPADALGFARGIASCDALRVRGLMTLAINSDQRAVVERCFARLVEVQTQLQDATGSPWDELSMGMSGDFDLAIACGSTCVRIGTAIFGHRRGR